MVGIEVPLILTGVAAASVAVASSARSTAPYAFLMAKARAWEARMLGDGKIESMADSSSLDSLLSGLRGTDYEQGLEGIDQDAWAFESALSGHLLEVYRELMNLVPRKGVTFMRKFAERLELGNLKLVIQAVSGLADRELALDNLTDGLVFSKDRLEVMARSENLEALVEQLSETDYYDEMSRYVDPGEYEPLDLMRAVEHGFYASLWKRTHDLGRKNGKIARDIIGREIDLANVKLVFRLKSAGVGPDVILKNMIPLEGELAVELLRLCAQSDSLDGVRSILSASPLKSTLVPLMSTAGDDVGELEQLLDESLTNYCKVLSLFKPLTIATPLSYLYQKHVEVRNVRTLARGIADGIPPEDIRKILMRSARVE
jgi:V/A-type H+-transporting ATPase subunit C